MGKSTLIANLLASYTPSPCPSAASSDDGAPHPSKAVVQVADDAERVVYCLTLQETPPLTSASVVQHVVATACREEAGGCALDCVLYLLPPHHVDPVDVAAITTMSQHAPVIPLLAKVRAWWSIIIWYHVHVCLFPSCLVWEYTHETHGGSG